MYTERSYPDIPYKQRVTAYSDEQIEAACRNMAGIKDNFDEEAVHDFRVAVKRMRVLMWFLSLFDESIIPDESIANERSFFKLLSPIRDRQVQMERMLKSSEDLAIKIPALMKYLSKRLRRAQNKFQLRKNEFMPQMHLDMVRMPLYHILSDEMILREAESQSALIFTKISEEMPRFIDEDKVMHESRKEVKKVIYLMEMLQVNNARINGNECTLTELKMLQEALGNAHDFVIGSKMIRKFIFEKEKSGQKYHRLAEWFDHNRILEIDRFKEQYSQMVCPGQAVNVEFLE